jgi:hypothetical protein
MRKVYMHGDVFLTPIERIPDGVKRKDNTVAYGEATGHHHTFTDDSAVEVYVDNNGQQYCRVRNDYATIGHQEHKPLSVPKGTYAVNVQREVDLIDGVRQVMD